MDINTVAGCSCTLAKMRIHASHHCTKTDIRAIRYHQDHNNIRYPTSLISEPAVGLIII